MNKKIEYTDTYIGIEGDDGRMVHYLSDFPAYQHITTLKKELSDKDEEIHLLKDAIDILEMQLEDYEKAKNSAILNARDRAIAVVKNQQLEKQLAEWKDKYFKLDEQFETEIPALIKKGLEHETEIQRLKGLLGEVKQCPHCDGSGVIPVNDHHGGWEQQQCQWCDEKNELLNK